MTTYPGELDSDLELPRASDDVTELSSDNINSVRDAVLAIEKAVGTNPQGNKTSFADRVNVSLDSNGNIKPDALTGIGLIALPITNSQVGSSAGIVESKLSLNYTTTALKNLIDSLRSDLDGALDGVGANTNKLNLHFLGQGHYHDGYHVKVNTTGSTGVAGLEATTIGDAINEISSYLLSGNGSTIEPHIDTGVPTSVKHAATGISVNTTNFSTIDSTATNVQLALDSVDVNATSFGAEHSDTFHTNGILKEIRSGSSYNANRELLASTSGVYYTEGTGVITIPGVTSFSSLNVKEGDIVYMPAQTGIADSGVSYQIRAAGPITEANTLGDLPVLAANQLAIFHTFVESRAAGDSVSVAIYKPASESSESAPLACAVRSNETIVDTLSIIHPSAARAVSIGFNGSIINTDGVDAGDGYAIGIRAGISSTKTRDIIIPYLNLERLNANQAPTVNAKSVAERINAYVTDPTIGQNFPITAARIGNELVVAHNWVGSDYTIEIRDGYSANFALGFDAYGADVVGETIKGNSGNKYNIDGTSSSTIRTLFDGYATISSDTDTFSLWTNAGAMINPLRYGIKSGSIMDISGHSNSITNGSYVLLSANSTSVSVFNADQIDNYDGTTTTFNVKFTDAHIPLTDLDNTEGDFGLVEVYINSSGQTMLHQRATYGDNLGSAIEVIDISNGFPSGQVSLSAERDGNNVQFYIVDETLEGETVTIHETFRGIVKVYHYNGLDYFKIKVSDGTIPGGIETVNVSNPLPSDGALPLCVAHFNNNLSITNLIDYRKFGNLGSDQANDDFIEVFSQQPVKDLRSDGVVRGFDLLDSLYYDSKSDTQALPIRGGVAYVNGVRVAVETQKVTVQSYDVEGALIKNEQKIVAINEFGTLQLVNDELGELLTDGYAAPSATYGKLLPLYQVDIINGGIDDVIDIRKFINNLDDKLEIIVDGTNELVGNFRTLEGALLFAEKYPAGEKLIVRILNSVSISSPVIVSDGVSIIGGARYGGESKHQIISDSVINQYLVTLDGNNVLSDVEVISPNVNLNGALVRVRGSNVAIEHCLFRFGEDVTTSSNDYAIEISRSSHKNIRIFDNKIDNVYSGIVSRYGVEDLFISENGISNINGTGGIAYGIRVGTGARQVKNMTIDNNTVRVPSIVLGTDLRGIEIESGLNIDVAKVTRNSIIHDAQNTMTNGIRISTIDGYAGVIDQLFVSDNYVDGVKLDDTNVFGMYISNATRVSVKNNTLLNIGVSSANRTNVAAIRIAATSAFVDITGNLIEDCAVTRGIEVEKQDQDTRVNICGNTLINLGTTAHYIRGLTPHSNISDNNLIGPGAIGIRWSGTNSNISNNHMSQPNNGSDTDYAFSEYAIFAPVSDVDISGNSLTGMVFYQGSRGIGNGAAGRDRLKIVGNTVAGSFMREMIDIYGNDHIINSNKLSNETLPTGMTTTGIELNTSSNILIMGNSIRGAVHYGLDSDATTLSNITVANNAVIATVNKASIMFDGTTTTCFVEGNRFPEGTESNTVGSAPTLGVYNSNLIGLNQYMSDTRTLPASAGTTGYDSTGATDFSQFPHWTLSDSARYWEITSVDTSDTRYLYFPITCLPNGAKLNSVQIHGKMPASGGGTLTAQLFKQSTKSGLTATAISTNTTISATAEFNNSTSTGTVSVTTSGGEICNYVESSYYLQILHAGASPTNPQDININGVTINFTY